MESVTLSHVLIYNLSTPAGEAYGWRSPIAVIDSAVGGVDEVIAFAVGPECADLAPGDYRLGIVWTDTPHPELAVTDVRINEPQPAVEPERRVKAAL